MNEDHINVLSKLNVLELDVLRQQFAAKGDVTRVAEVDAAVTRAMPAAQTDVLARCGKLFPHRISDPDTGRVRTSFVGDIGAAFGVFMQDGTRAKLNQSLIRGEHSPAAKALRAA